MTTPEDPATPANRVPDNDDRPQALRAELAELADVVGPIELVAMLIERAFQLHATDIHLDPKPNGLRVRLRVDGLLHDILHVPASMRYNVISRLKLLATLDLTNRRHCQDGHIPHATLGGTRDVRIGTSPTIHGERVVLRLLPDATEYNNLDLLGLEPDQLVTLEKQLENPYGMILVAGPVGAGKSTTLYSALAQLHNPRTSITTIEDPVERRMDGINQIQVEPRDNFGFVQALRGVLRQDPNVLMVGEVRDPDTAHIACRAGLTGVLVLSTIHATDSASVIDVLREYDVPPMFIADSVRCIVSQRLMRKVCPVSRETYEPDAATCQALGIPAKKAGQTPLTRGIPAPVNFHTGYAGRTGAFEVLPITSAIRRAILEGAPQSRIAEIAAQEGMRSMREVARDKVLSGITSIDEWHRVAMSI